MLASILSVRSLLIAIFVMMAGSGFLSTLIGLRLERAGSGTMAIGLVATAYFAGLVLGALRAGIVVRPLGHIRALAAFVALLSATTLASALLQPPMFRRPLRTLHPLCFSALSICLDSWPPPRPEPAPRAHPTPSQ